MNDIDINRVNRSVARVESAGNAFNWYRPFESGKPIANVGSATIVRIPQSLLDAANKEVVEERIEGEKEVEEQKKDEKKTAPPFTSKTVFLLTAYHVVAEGKRIWSTFGAVTRQRYKTRVVCVIPEIDIALLRVDSVLDVERKQLGHIDWGNSDLLVQNQTVFAAGFPHGQHSVKLARGIISGREQGSIQFDATVNAGNSGGPLLDSKTRIVGVVASSERNAQAMNYATPIDQVVFRLSRIVTRRGNSPFGTMESLPSFNMRTSLATSALLKQIGSPRDGAYVRFVQKHTPLYEEGGLRKGDVLLAIRTDKDGWMQVGVDGDVSAPFWSSPITLNTIQRRLSIGDKVGIRYWSTVERKVVEKEVLLSESDAMVLREYDSRYERPDYELFGGAVVMQLAVNHMTRSGTAEPGSNWVERFAYLKQQIEKRTEPMLVVTHILPSSSLTATLITLGPGDVVSEVSGIRVKTLAEYREALHSDPKFIVWKTEDGMATAIDYKTAEKEFKK